MMTESTQTPAEGTPVTRDFITVRVGPVPGSIKDIALNGGRTVQDALNGRGINANGLASVFVNGNQAGSFEDVLEEGDTVYVTRPLRGNNA